MGIGRNKRSIVNDAIVKEIFEAVDGLEFGQIQITVHDSKIVQVDKTAKKRFEDIWIVEKGGGI